jgi:hypothetical protein
MGDEQVAEVLPLDREIVGRRCETGPDGAVHYR